MKIGERRNENIPLYEQEERFEYINWKEKLKEHKETLAREEKKMNEKILRAEKMKKGWELLRICMQFIRDNRERLKREKQARQDPLQCSRKTSQT